MVSKCRHIKVEIQGSEVHCADCFDILASKPKPARRRPTDSERLTWLLKGGCTKEYTYDYSKYAYEIRRRAMIDRLMREEARRGKK